MQSQTSITSLNVVKIRSEIRRIEPMSGILNLVLAPFLGVVAVAYAVLSIRVTRAGPRYANSMISFLMILIAGMLAGSAFSYGTHDANVYGIGRVLSYSSIGFIPLVFYGIYREYTVGPPRPWVVALLAIVPTLTIVLALTNSMHNMIWVATETPDGLQIVPFSEHLWYRRVFAPFTYGLFAYSGFALLGHLPTIAPAHRKIVLMLLICAVFPFTIGIANSLGMGPPEFPFTSTTLALLFPFFAYASVKLRVHEFSPLAYQNLFNHVRDAIFVVDSEQCIIYANKAAQHLLRDNERKLIGRKLWEDFPIARAILEQARELDLTQTVKMDSNRSYEVSVGSLTGPKGQNIGMVVVCRDVTERRKVLEQLAESEHLVRTLIETSSNGILRFARDQNDPDQKFRCVFANRAAESFAGEGQGTLVGMPLEKLGFLDSEKLLRHFGGETKVTSQVSYEMAAESGEEENWLRVVGEPVGDDFSVTMVDITQRKHNENKMLADALRDPLTGVLNRRGFEQEGASCLRRSSIGAALYLDLNNFKSINDRFGHQAGDALLKAFGHRLEYCLRPEDVLGRLGGDEFAIVLPGVSLEDVKRVAHRLVQTSSEAYIIQGQEIKCTASVGISLMPKHGEELWHLLSVADKAMYEAKSIPEEEAANDRAAYVDAATAS